MNKYYFTFAFTFFIILAQLKADALQQFVLFQNDTINKVDINSMKQGRWIYFGRDKKLVEYKDDQVVEEGSFEDNRKQGIWKKYYPSGSMQSEITYKSSRPNGYAKIYYENGKIKEEGLWEGNKWTGQYKLYHENGNVMQDFNFTENGKREGIQKYYHENGQVMIEGEWKEGKENGVLKEYTADGTLKSEKFFNGGSLDPVSTVIYETAEPVKEEPKAVVSKVVVEKDEEPNIGIFEGNGHHKLYNKNKQISKEGDFKNYKLVNGKYYRYDENGILLRIEVYKKGRYTGDAPIEEDIQ